MSPFLENWYPQDNCKYCGEPIMFENRVPLESDGTDHRDRCSSRNQPSTFSPSPVIPEKPRHTLRALEHEVLHEGQRTLASFSRTHKKVYPERYPK